MQPNNQKFSFWGWTRMNTDRQSSNVSNRFHKDALSPECSIFPPLNLNGIRTKTLSSFLCQIGYYCCGSQLAAVHSAHTQIYNQVPWALRMLLVNAIRYRREMKWLCKWVPLSESDLSGKLLDTVSVSSKFSYPVTPVEPEPNIIVSVFV